MTITDTYNQIGSRIFFNLKIFYFIIIIIILFWLMRILKNWVGRTLVFLPLLPPLLMLWVGHFIYLSHLSGLRGEREFRDSYLEMETGFNLWPLNFGAVGQLHHAICFLTSIHVLYWGSTTSRKSTWHWQSFSELKTLCVFFSPHWAPQAPPLFFMSHVWYCDL